RIERSFELELHLIFGVKMVRFYPDRAAHVVHEHVDPPERGMRLRHQRLRARECAQVDQHFHRLGSMRAQFVQSFRRALIDTIGDDDPAALLSKPLGGGAADPLAGSRDDTHLAAEPTRAGSSRIKVVRHAASPHRSCDLMSAYTFPAGTWRA